LVTYDPYLPIEQIDQINIGKIEHQFSLINNGHVVFVNYFNNAFQLHTLKLSSEFTLSGELTMLSYGNYKENTITEDSFIYCTDSFMLFTTGEYENNYSLMKYDFQSQ